MQITGIERQKKDRTRLSVFIDGAFAFGVSEEVYGRFVLHTGQELTSEEREEIERAEAESAVRRSALRFRSYRPRSSSEVRQYLLRKGYDERTADSALAYLTEHRLLDDAEFARMAVRDRLKMKPVGQSVMRQLLMKKGVAKNVIDSVLAEYYSSEAESALARAEGERRMKRLTALPPLAQKKRLYDHLVRRGYSSAAAMAVVHQLIPS